MMLNVNPENRWYRIPIVWMVIGIPAFSVVFTLSIVWISVQTYDGVVVDDYYRKGLEINRDLERDRYASKAGLQASVLIENGQLHVELKSLIDEQWPSSLTLGFFHPTVSNRDITIQLQHQGAGRYNAAMAEPGFGKWNVVTGTDTWRLKGVLFHPAEAGFVLKPVQSLDVSG